MIDARILPMQRRALSSIAHWLAQRRVTADAISLTGFGIGALAVPALAAG